jgi:hypothetical protein
VDPLPGLAQYVERTRLETTFYITSACDPSVFDNLRDNTVRIFHPQAEEMTCPQGQYVVSGGTTTITRAPFLAHMLGFRDITIYGADSSFNGSIYCYQHGTFADDLDEPVLKVAVGDELFETELGLMKQVAQLGVISGKLNARSSSTVVG